MTREPQPASDVVDGLAGMLVDRYRAALREAVALLDKRRHPGFAESCATPGCGCPVCAFVSRPDVLRLLAGEQTAPTCRVLPPNAASHLPDCRWYPAPLNRGPYWGCADGCNAHRQPAQTCGECGGTGTRLRCQARDTPHDPECYGPCPACHPAQPEAGAE